MSGGQPPRGQQAPPHRGALHAREPNAIHRALRVLEVVAAHGTGVTAKEVSDALDYPSATTYRLLNLLVQDRYLVRTPDLKGFALGSKVSEIAMWVEPRRTTQAVRDLLAELRTQLRAGVHLLRIDSGRVSMWDPDPMFPPPHLEKRLSAVTYTALELLLAPNRAVGHGSIDSDGLSHAVDSVSDLPSVAAPIRDEHGRIVASLLLIATAPRVAPGQREALMLRDYAERLTPLIA